MRRAPLFFFGMLVNTAVLLDACGSRTGLPVDDVPITTEDASDGPHKHEAGFDSAPDVIDEDALPPIDANPNPDVNRNDCPDADATLVYVVSQTNELYSFYPPSLTFSLIGRIACPSSGSPYSMAVDRKGKAYVVFTPAGDLFQVSTATAACIKTPFPPGQSGFTTFGMGFVSNTGGPDETLYVAEGTAAGTGPSLGLASIDTTTYKLNFIGPFNPSQSRVEFTGTGDGRLFGYSPSDTGSHIIQVDKSNANVIASDSVNAGATFDAFAFAYWGGDFWIFTGQPPVSSVYRYTPATRTTTLVTSAPTLIVGAGVSTCAPQ